MTFKQLKNIILPQNSSLGDVMKCFDENASYTNSKGFVIIINFDGIAVGVVTDGDIRREISKGTGLDVHVDQVMNQNYIYVKSMDNTNDVIKKFDKQITVLPVLNEKGEPVDLYFSSQFIDIKLIQPIFEPDLSGKEREYVANAVNTGWISSQGTYIPTFEKLFAKRFGKQYGIASSSCTSALHLSLVALGIGVGDEVICPDLTFIAPANMIALTGATPVLVDVEEETWNLDPKLVYQAISEKTKALLVVHAFGHAARMDEIVKIATKYDLPIIEDNAESPGGYFKNELLGSIGTLSCFSFFANKIITTGEGGMVLTDDEELYIRLCQLRDHGMSHHHRYESVVLGFNYRMTNMQAAVGLAQLERLEEILELRWQQEKLYEKLLSVSNQINLRPKQPWAKTVHWLMTIQFRKNGIRNKMIEYLKQNKIDCRQMINPVHEALHFRENYNANDFPVSKRVAHNSMHLPSSTRLSSEIIEQITDTILMGLEQNR